MTLDDSPARADIEEPSTPEEHLAATSARPRLLERIGAVGAALRSSRWTLPGIVTLTILASFVMRALVPILVVGSGGDDLLFVRSATSLNSGHWLGPLDYLTLSKGPAYPAFIDAMKLLSIPLKIGEQFTLLVAAGLLALCIGLTLRHAGYAVAAFVVFAFLPDDFGAMSASVLRDSWYASLSLLLPVAFLLTLQTSRHSNRARWPVMTAALTGLTAATFWMCREEGIWILPTLAVIGAWFVIGMVRRRRQSDAHEVARRSFVRRIARPVAVLTALLVTSAGPVAFVMMENSHKYGVALTNDMTSGQIPRAYAEWLRVRAGHYQSSVPINWEQREAVYAVSPAARELKPWLDDKPNGWLAHGCVSRPGRRCDYRGSVMIWAIRSAAQTVGHFGSETDAQRYFGDIADQIADGCSAKRLDCAPQLPTVLQPLQRVRAGEMISALGSAVSAVLWSSDFTVLPAADFHRARSAIDRTHRIVPATPPTNDQALADIRTFRGHDWPYRILDIVYRIAFPILLLAGIVGLVLATIRNRAARSPLIVLGSALLLGAISRLVLVAITATSQFSTGLRYQTPTRTLLFGTAVVGTVLLIDTWKRPRPTDQADAIELPVAD